MASAELQRADDMTHEWQTTQYSDRPGFVRWRPILPVSTQEAYCGISEEDEWIFVGATATPPGTGRFGRALLPMLETRLADLKQRLAESLSRIERPTALVDSFPFEEVLLAGIDIGSDYWAELALGWLRDTNSGVSPEVIDRLRKVVYPSQFSQHVRHLAHAELQRRLASLDLPTLVGLIDDEEIREEAEAVIAAGQGLDVANTEQMVDTLQKRVFESRKALRELFVPLQQKLNAFRRELFKNLAQRGGM
ncbi:MAG: hypothetical protein IT186_12220 [Acidobacteria bacterium]|nr:hypothetical protein [Acidobacteriota bacterium]